MGMGKGPMGDWVVAEGALGWHWWALGGTGGRQVLGQGGGLPPAVRAVVALGDVCGGVNTKDKGRHTHVVPSCKTSPCKVPVPGCVPV